MTVNTIVFGLAIELFTFGTALSIQQIMLINEHTMPLLFAGVIAAVFFPLIAKMWDYGVENLNFEIHESALNQMVNPPESWSNLFLALLDETALRSQELTTLVQLIEEAPGAVERQDRRAEVKAWLKANRDQLTDEDREFVREHLGYLK